MNMHQGLFVLVYLDLKTSSICATIQLLIMY
jgi:hypothetical protein